MWLVAYINQCEYALRSSGLGMSATVLILSGGVASIAAFHIIGLLVSHRIIYKSFLLPFDLVAGLVAHRLYWKTAIQHTRDEQDEGAFAP